MQHYITDKGWFIAWLNYAKNNIVGQTGEISDTPLSRYIKRYSDCDVAEVGEDYIYLEWENENGPDPIYELINTPEWMVNVLDKLAEIDYKYVTGQTVLNLIK